MDKAAQIETLSCLLSEKIHGKIPEELMLRILVAWQQEPLTTRIFAKKKQQKAMNR